MATPAVRDVVRACNRPSILNASRYELERLEHVLWVEIMANENITYDVLIAHRSLKTELALRTRTTLH
ncbi:adenosylmethionine-8-amino-7-oxononanoate aminotransferase [Novimethylophilus kurashikiensis]|uniref:Adenosylmethionine-8-amino-7-oxononanoate aminotransferase n=1 Tax=Novimethylophilus kurashikiensis TaxID=1825523 RepID=A0A2R5FC14_9PROT|nr:hypothetical protein [Novimethylophilus kurashikiensis]GBG14241.1 adenosylmethionine-8-amino-7-oxononanoate aminotransferase [Novimethylophilus kurashikiensis]